MSPITVKLVHDRVKTMTTRLAVTNMNGDIIVPYIVGDVVNVKESCALVGSFYRYKSHDEGANDRGVEWKKPHEMPMKACRLRLRVKSIKLIDIKDTTEGEAMKEGLMQMANGKYKMPGLKEQFDTWQHAFSALWNKTTAHRWKNGQNVLWRDNPKVWKIEFARISTKNRSKQKNR